MCDECKRLQGEVADAQKEVTDAEEKWYRSEARSVVAEDELGSAESASREALEEKAAHEEDCAEVYRKSARAAGQTDLLGGGA